MLQPTLKKIIKETAEELNLPVDVVEEIFTSQFKCTKEVLDNIETYNLETYKVVRYQHLGTLRYQPKRIEKAWKTSIRNKERTLKFTKESQSGKTKQTD